MTGTYILTPFKWSPCMKGNLSLTVQADDICTGMNFVMKRIELCLYSPNSKLMRPNSFLFVSANKNYVVKELES